MQYIYSRLLCFGPIYDSYAEVFSLYNHDEMTDNRIVSSTVLSSLLPTSSLNSKPDIFDHCWWREGSSSWLIRKFDPMKISWAVWLVLGVWDILNPFTILYQFYIIRRIPSFLTYSHNNLLNFHHHFYILLFIILILFSIFYIIHVDNSYEI